MYYKYLDLLKDKAKRSVVQYKLAACIIKNNKIIGKPRTNALHHAEVNVINDIKINNLLNKKQKNYDILVIRLDKHGSTGNARPCLNCLELMKKIGIHKIYYSIENDKIISENVKKMVSIHKSSVARTLDKQQQNNLQNNYTYYDNLIKKFFPININEYHLNNFIKYNLNNILPTYKVIINKKEISIVNHENNIIVKSKLN